MYHDIAYPIQKMEDITKKYLDRLNPGMDGQVGDDMAIEVKIGFGKLLASDLFGSRLRVITDALVDDLFPEMTGRMGKARKMQIERLAEYLKQTYNSINLAMYKNGLKDILYQFCLKLALNHGEHGILSSLLFDSAARSSCLPIRMIRKGISVAILGHHMLDKGGKWALTDRWTFERSKPGDSTKTKNGTGRERFDAALETARSIAWDPSFLLYDLRKNNKNSSFFGTLLILCDSVSQWGRTDNETDRKLALLMNRDKNEEALVVLCYPKTRKKKDALKFRDHYENQLMHLTGPPRLEDGKRKNGFVKLLYNCPIYRSNQNLTVSAERCNECKRMSPTVKEKIGVIPLTFEPRSFPDVLQAHEEIYQEAQKRKENKKNNCS